ncbi:uncharacterized protein CDV56_102548 [Aspergillus thermomutatus]|uniref:Peptidase metallopeptidase domain-containing protein n=1 Tax=Aspergillus thermomutatus TaxID=41047 RepID=A0A397G5V5_ASPTH|nr:uncharacterized protein CDV56_102548 [Aspergillus thermomutatus]RHZ46402.1 hypothetical protein CDV56_102548 [Aspergillus thermomutatus]
MPQQSHLTINPNSKKELLKRWREVAGEKSLKTVAADYTSQTVAGIVDLQDKNNVSISESAYHCATQSSLPANIPSSDVLSLQIGLQVSGNRVIYRWKKNSKINFAAFAEGYATSDQALFAARMLKKATDEWNELQLGVKFEWVSDVEDAAFVLAYGGDAGSTLARAFFPNEQDLNMLYVYRLAFEPGKINYMKNIFLHELGHVLGLRHEFAPETEGGTVQLGPRNNKSVMSYTFPPVIQTTDVESTLQFYSLTDAQIGGWPIEDCVPNN